MARFERIRKEIESIKSRDPAAENIAEILLLYPGVHALLLHRAAHNLHKSGKVFTARLISQTARFMTGIEIHPGATIGEGLFIDHGSGVVIGETAEIGNNCTIYQGVTLGGTGKDTGKRHPTIGDNVLIGSGARVLGPVNVGNNVKIAAGAVVLDDLPDDCTAVGVPARIVRRKGKKIDNNNPSSELDQIHIPDPVAQELCKMRIQFEALEKKVLDTAGTNTSDLLKKIAELEREITELKNRCAK